MMLAIAEHAAHAHDSRFFIDGDTLVMILSHNPDFYRISVQILDTIDNHPDTQLQSVLIDCALLGENRSRSLHCFIEVGRSIINRRLRLLLLDATPACYRQLAPRLPDAVWIDSSTAGYFGQEMKGKLLSG